METNCIQDEDLYTISKKKAMIFFIISLFLAFFKVVLFIFDTLAFCILIIFILLSMFLGYSGLISRNPSLVCAKAYVGVVFFCIMLDFLISFLCCCYIYRLAVGDYDYMHITKVDYIYSYFIFISVVVFCLLSTIINIFSIYYTRKFKKLIIPFQMRNEKKDVCLV
ncbi:conserved Plasmodium membrane protein, unknown function [Plasmodium gallinaceum]|uniref:Uncharacterized protein n=1 Tax=Plasmodium gallinaceum TaxID=5849 RepID=A0A1J1GTZ8_PLAGA|nr:conserved Plasmodium membrane protein, unknown function [Plasmodium gallinaceum]CRG95988.1 conserved Plasmodium membrane protein, unknown function [Plasmodium gallinaceum]